MQRHIPPIANLIEQFEKLPGIGHKTAQRLAFHMLSRPQEQAQAFADALVAAKTRIKRCSVCLNYCEGERCTLCAAPGRDRSVICVVESPKDVLAIEAMRDYKGLYHVLGGVISPMEQVNPQDLAIKELLLRLEGPDVQEVILATNPDIEGEATAMYLSRLLKPLGLTVTRIASGLPIGGDLEYADEMTLMRALQGRREC